MILEDVAEEDLHEVRGGAGPFARDKLSHLAKRSMMTVTAVYPALDWGDE